MCTTSNIGSKVGPPRMCLKEKTKKRTSSRLDNNRPDQTRPDQTKPTTDQATPNSTINNTKHYQINLALLGSVSFKE